jgi:hypothetical protein
LQSVLRIFKRKKTEHGIIPDEIIKEVAKPSIRKGCARCKFAEIADSWHIQSNRCLLRNFTLGKNILEEDGCERWQERKF